MKLLVVESPAKAKTINKYLGSDYEVIASFGHIRDLPAKDGSVEPDNDFSMKWEIEGRGAKQVAEIARAVKGAEKLILATDPDREGEAISWHVLEALNQKRVLKGIPVERVTFNAVTKDAVQKALANPRAIDQALVDAYLARRALDYLVGFTLSPVLWRKLPGARSAGRVQSVALRLVCDREREIEAFRAREYWSLVATLATASGQTFEARLVGADGKKIARLDIGNEEEAKAFKAALESALFTVSEVEAKPVKRHPQPPFQTSTLQQEASRKLGLAPARTMQLAQRLYEGVDIGGETVGLITYMRTDGVDMDGSAIAAARRVIGKEFGEKYVPNAPRKYTVKAKNAQEAHEAIRPTDLGRLPAMVARHLEPEQAKLYELIWKRTIASQMESAEMERTTVDIAAKVGARNLELRASGQVVLFDGFLTLYQESRDDEEDEDSKKLPAMKAGDKLEKRDIAADQHFTEPPPRFSEASLVKRMEELGIGRPSTYAATLSTLRDREYVRIEKKRLVPEDKGMLVTSFLESFFKRYVEFDFTANLEEKLDRVSNAEIDWKALLREFWDEFQASIGETKDLRVGDVLEALNGILGEYIFPQKADGSDPRVCPTCGTGQLSLKLGKFGAFVGCSNYPECRYTRPLSVPAADGEASAEGGQGAPGVRILGTDPVTNLEVTLRDGRFGPYIQLGEGEKPKRSSLPKGMSPASVTLEKALALLSLPREVARHPESGEPILVGIGRFGPYVQHGKVYANIDKDDDVLELGANRAIDLIVAKESGGGRGRAAATPGRALGDHPAGGALEVKAGKYGPYVAWGKIFATLPKTMTAESITLEQAIELANAKAEAKGGKGKPKAAAGAAKAKAPAKKPAAKKAPAKKAAEAEPAAKKAPKAARG
ncbi:MULTISPECIES: type I DNA topoisomerase [Bosea]|uniref:type I DNA topoisomerase n=1 Tax=Bosea TaxID=85413 RepID=UPI0021503D04|nr:MULTISPECIES: type I DNA topoisomerase [Bosea]MCR4520541.1 type I DNA topoisomerase [Bosea sp. 47.2.35]MDR6827895.1 DNA topoisomerase-1 [Bosea robiniae]MDR6894411.1 DNA topoisomerase-1 [Bosea sp. BE109]MDR7138001.1 DNA topoisomerase-1 [Bosea sp. BE168]MDR7174700.1 DNA topoisomerase-1 [Bosea sp. BE271]